MTKYKELEIAASDIAGLYIPYFTEARKRIIKHVEWFKLTNSNVGILTNFYIEEIDRLERIKESGRKFIPSRELDSLDFNLESYIISYGQYRTSRKRKVS